MSLELISKMPQENDGGGQMNHPEEVVGISFPTDDDTAKIVEPGEEPFNFPSPPRAPQRPAILSDDSTPRIGRRDQFDVVGRREMLVEAIAVVGDVADQPRRQLAEESRR